MSSKETGNGPERVARTEACDIDSYRPISGTRRTIRRHRAFREPSHYGNWAGEICGGTPIREDDIARGREYW